MAVRPLRMLLVATGLVAGLGAVAAVGVLAYGREALWQRVAGPADAGPYDFDAPTRSGHPNDVLMCPEGYCAGAAPELIAPRYPEPPAAVLDRLAAVLAATAGVEQIVRDDGAGTLRAVARTELMRFPDRLHFRVTADPAGGTRLWAYAASVVGRGDFGVNRARIEEITRRLASATAAGGT